jgi:hypothetical protein
MSKFSLCPLHGLAALLACAAVLWAPAALAAEAAAPEMATPAPFKHYQGWRDEALQDWREANARVGEIGGWRTYLRESRQDEAVDQGHHDHRGH